MKTLIRQDAEIGMVVKLVAPDPGYTLGPNNPAVGTPWECTGIIVDTKYQLKVKWENGSSNMYKNNELAFYNNSYIDIWQSI